MTTYSRLTCISLFNPHPEDLTLNAVDVSVSIVDTYAQVYLSQHFFNPFPNNVEATYSFAMLTDSSVCGFEMVRGDGTKVLVEGTQKKTGKEAYQTPVSQMRYACSGEEQTKDVFSIKVGSILALETVSINLTFLTTLLDGENRNQATFTFPRGYASRFGAPCADRAATALHALGSEEAFSIVVAIQQSSPIKALSCPSSHPVQLCLGRPDGVDVVSAIPESYFASVQMTSSASFLTQDLVLMVTADGLDTSRCFVEPHPSPEENTTAFGMTFVPRLNLPDSHSGMEYIFVIDRSGSMEVISLSLVKEALVVLLRGLPLDNTTFNIFSFGTKTTSLWSSSKPYTQSTLEEATHYVDSMDASYGGTEIAQALKKVIDSLPKKRQKPVSIFLLTDGGAWDVSACEEYARALVSAPGAIGRIFAVGIGSSASSTTVDSIAQAGEGTAIYVEDGEPMTTKLAGLVRASRTPAIKNLEVLWPCSEEDCEVVEEIDAKERSSVGSALNPIVQLKDIIIPPLQRAPLRVPELFLGTRTRFYAIAPSLSTIPSSITIRGRVTTTGGVVELDVPITRTAIFAQHHHTLIHALAAHALITNRPNDGHSLDVHMAEHVDTLQAYIEVDFVGMGTNHVSTYDKSYVGLDGGPSGQQSTDGPDVMPPPYSMTGSKLTMRDQLDVVYIPPFSSLEAPARSESTRIPWESTSSSSISEYAQDRTRELREISDEYLSSTSIVPGLSKLLPDKPPSDGPDVMPPPCTASMNSSTSKDRLGAIRSRLSARSVAPVSMSLNPKRFFSNDTIERRKVLRECSDSSLLGPPAVLQPRPRSYSNPSPMKSLVESSLQPESLVYTDNTVKLSKQKSKHSSPVFPPFSSLWPSFFKRRSKMANEKKETRSLVGSRSKKVDEREESSLVRVARLQRFDGSFVLSDRLIETIRPKHTVKATEAAFLDNSAFSSEIMATTLALVWMKKELEQEAIDLIEKAKEWLRKNVVTQSQLEALQSVAEGLVI